MILRGSPGKAFGRMRDAQHPEYPLTVYYAFKQSEADEDTDEEGDRTVTPVSTGWETMLEGLLKSHFAITGTWPMRTESVVALKANVGTLASSVVLVCRPRLRDARALLTVDYCRYIINFLRICQRMRRGPRKHPASLVGEDGARAKGEGDGAVV